MKNISKLLIISAIVALGGCKSQQKNVTGGLPVIDLASNVGKGEVVNLSDVAHDIRYVKLETSDSSLIGRYPTVFYENERIYVLSMRVLKVFDKDGKFLFKFDRRGRGAQEYVASRRIRAMHGSGDILVQTQAIGASDNLMFFDREGNYLDKKNVPYNKNTFQSDVLEIGDNLYVAAASPKYKDSIQLCAIIYDSTFTILKTIPAPTNTDFEKDDGDSFVVVSADGKEIPSANLSVIRFPEIYRFKENIRFLFSGNDTIFSIDSKQNYTPSFWINFGKYKKVSGKASEMNLYSGNYITLRQVYFIESEENMILQFYMRDFCHEPYEEPISTPKGVRINKHTDCYALYNKKTGEFTLLNQPVKNMPGLKDDIKNGPPFLPASISSDFQACALFNASQIIEYAHANDLKGELKEIAKDLKDTDNPIVAIAKMR